MRENGRIIRLLDNNLAEVEFEATSACAKCKGCKVSEVGRMVLQATNQIGAKVGDPVLVEIPEAESIRATLLVFIFPVIGLVAGYFTGIRIFPDSEVMGIIGSITFLSITFLLLNIYDKKLAQKAECKASVRRIL